MSLLSRYQRLVWGLLLAGAFAWGAAAPAPAQTVTLTRPTRGPAKLGGVSRMDVTLSAAPAGYSWSRVAIEVRTMGGVLEESGNATLLPGGTLASYECVTSTHVDAQYKLKAVGTLKNNATGTETSQDSTETTDEVDNPIKERPRPRNSLAESRLLDAGATSPLSGSEAFSVPISSWEFKGESYAFALTYNSLATSDPQSPGAGFSGLGERNSYGQSGFRWSHNFNQWIDRAVDENGQRYALWHVGGRHVSFRWTGTAWEAEQPSITLTAGGGTTTSPTLYSNGQSTSVTVNESWFVVKDGEGTQYHFNYRPPTGQNHLAWITSEATALPHYLLTRIRDRFGRTVNLSWNTSSEPRVTASRKSDVAEGSATTYEFDELNRIKKITPPSPWQSVAFQYLTDAYQRWITQVTVGGISGNWLYREDTKGRLSEVVSPVLAAGSNTWVFQYDKDGKNILLQHPNHDGDADGLRVQELRSYSTDGRDWLTSLTLKDADGVTKDVFSYTYGFAGELLSETDNGARVHSFSYDSLYRLRTETHPDFGPGGGVPGTIEYQYDPNGNRTKRIVRGGVAPNGFTDYYQVDANDRLWWVNRRTDGATASRAPSSEQALPYTLYDYDANGRVTYRERRHETGALRKLTLWWDGDDRLKQVWQNDGTQTASVFSGLYDEGGLRVRKTETWPGLNGGSPLTHDYSWGPGGVVHDSASGGTTYTPGLHHQTGTTDRFYHSDWLGSTRYLSDGTGTVETATQR